jgi:hypothetical protein
VTRRPHPTAPLARRLLLGAAAAASALALAGCGVGAAGSALAGSSALVLSGGGAVIDTNCTGCNATNSRGAAVYRFSAQAAGTSSGGTSTGGIGAGETATGGTGADVIWSVSGGDPKAGPGSIDSSGQYTPPGFLTQDSTEVTVTARLVSGQGGSATAHITITPGFLEPLAPENVALAAGGSVTLTGRLAEAGGHTAIRFSLTGAGAGSAEGGLGSLSSTECERSAEAFTACTVTYTAPAVIDAPQMAYVTAGAGAAKTEMAILLNPAGVSSNPTQHRSALAWPIPLGGSGGNNGDLDAHGASVSDCCGGTLGALVADSAGRQFLLSNNHVLARSDHAEPGEAIVQPGLIDNNCTPNGDGPGTTPVASLSAWLPLRSPQTNADAAIAQPGSRMVDSTGAILELGARQPDGSLASAPPGISSTSGKGETARLAMQVAKSGRTTGLTCGSVSAIDVDVAVDYFEDCAETRPYLTKLFTHQLALSGDRFSDAGDSGALVVDAANAEPVGLFFAGGVDSSGVVEGMATPAPEVLSELGALSGSGSGSATSYAFVGGADHAVSCLSYGDSTVTAAQREPLSTVETARAQQALYAARALVNPAAGILGVAVGKSSDRAGEAAVIVYIDQARLETRVDEAKAPNVPASVPVSIGGVRTAVIPSTAQAVALGSAPAANALAAAPALLSASLAHAQEVKQQSARRLMRENPAIFGVGVGQSLDNPREPALVLYVDRNRLPADLPLAVGGLRTHYIVMDRLHVTRSYSVAGPARHCVPHAADDTQIFTQHRLPLTSSNW